MDKARAQRWHDTDHGSQRGKPLRNSKFIKVLPDEVPDWVSPCWCCCEICNPGWNPGGRTNPYWSLASLRQA